MNEGKFFLRPNDLIGLGILALLLLLICPIFMESFRLAQQARFLSLSFVAVALVLCWGYGGILSLGQGVFFGLGGYLMAMCLKLEASRPGPDETRNPLGLPDFMVWGRVEELPWWWYPAYSLPLTILLILTIPVILAAIISYALFRRRVGGVYFAIVSLAFASILTILIIGQQPVTGGVNGITNFKTLLGFDILSDGGRRTTYYICCALLFLALLSGYYIKSSKVGRLLLAQRDREERVRFSGYDVTQFKVFIFCYAALLSSIGGALYSLQVGFIAPSLIGVSASVEMVIFTAVGGRFSLIGAIYGALLVNWAKTFLSEEFPTLWSYFLGGVLIAVILFLPKGLMGIVEVVIDYSKKLISGRATQMEPRPGSTTEAA